LNILSTCRWWAHRGRKQWTELVGEQHVWSTSIWFHVNSKCEQHQLSQRCWWVS
jgi:hypothetical protein